MNKRTYEDYAKANCIPTGYNEAVTQYIFGQSTVDMLLDKIDKLQEWVEAEIEEVEVLIDPCAEEYERLCGVLSTFQKVLDKIKE